MLLLFDLKEVEMLDFSPGQIYVKIQWVNCINSDYMDPHTRSLKGDSDNKFFFGERLILSTDDILKQVRFKLEICDRKNRQILGTVDMDVSQTNLSDNVAYVPIKNCSEKAKVTYSIAWQSQYHDIVSDNHADLTKKRKRGRRGVGRRALSLSRSAHWSVIPEAVQRTFQSSPSENSTQILSLTPIQCGEEEIILEGKFEDGKFVEIIRSNCQVVNQTEVPLIVGTCSKSDGKNANVVEIGLVLPGNHLALPAYWHSEGTLLLCVAIAWIELNFPVFFKQSTLELLFALSFPLLRVLMTKVSLNPVNTTGALIL